MVNFRDPSGDRETETGSARVGIAAASRLVNAIKSLKYVLLFGRRDADAVVRDRDLIHIAVGNAVDSDAAAGAGIFKGSVEHVKKHTPEKRFVPRETHIRSSI